MCFNINTWLLFVQDDCLARLCLLVKDGNWTEGLKIWSMFHTFNHPISPEPQRPMADEELVDVVHSVFMPGHRKTEHGGEEKKNKEEKKRGGGGKREKKRGRDRRGRREKKDADGAREKEVSEKEVSEDVNGVKAEGGGGGEDDSGEKNDSEPAQEEEKDKEASDDGNGVKKDEEASSEQQRAEDEEIKGTDSLEMSEKTGEDESESDEPACKFDGVTEAGDSASVAPAHAPVVLPTEAGDATSTLKAEPVHSLPKDCHVVIDAAGDASSSVQPKSPLSSPAKSVDAVSEDSSPTEESTADSEKTEDGVMVNGAGSSVDPDTPVATEDQNAVSCVFVCECHTIIFTSLHCI
jgi:hypothetical protein